MIMAMEGFVKNIGLEIHIQLNTKSKAFCRDRNQFGQEANTSISEISLGYPGTLPVLNRNHMISAIKLGHALGCRISELQFFDRKNYHYPDLPKAYQITQDSIPVCIGGSFEYISQGEKKTIAIHHIHCEEDAGKNIHDLDATASLVDYNRAGTPLLEMVTEPDFTSGQEVQDFIADLQRLVRYLEISDANMEEGSMRCDCNVSIRPADSVSLGTRVEIKNVNSKKFASKAIEYEAQRQYTEIQAGNPLTQETRLYDPTQNKTYPMRSKEEVNDYRYFPDPDLQPIVLDSEMVGNIKKSIDVLPNEAESKLVSDGLNDEQVSQIVAEKNYFLAYQNLSSQTSNPIQSANFLLTNAIPFCKQNQIHIQEYPIEVEKINSIFQLLESKDLSHSASNQNLIPYLIENKTSNVEDAMNALNLSSSSDTNELETIASNIIQKYPDKVKAYQKGKKGLIGFFMGEAMRSSTTKFRPDIMKSIFEKLLM